MKSNNDEPLKMSNVT